MWSLKLLLLFILAVFPIILDGKEIFDVTTVYDVGNLCPKSETILSTPKLLENVSRAGFDKHCSKDIKGEVFARKNALGLQLTDGKKKFDSILAQQFNITCDTDSTCNWNLTIGKSINGEEDIHDQSVYPITSRVGFLCREPSCEGIILLTTSDSLVRKSPGYYRLKFEIGRVYLAKCNPSSNGYYGHTDRDGQHFSPSCYQISEFANNSPYLWLHFESSGIKIWNDQFQSTMTVDWKDNDFQEMSAVDVKFFSIYDANKLSLLTKGVCGSETSPGLFTIAMTSPLFKPSSKNICLAVVLHSNSNVIEDELQVSVGNQLKKDYLLQTLRGSQTGLNYKLLNLTLPDDLEGPIYIMIKVSSSQNTISIQRIAPCSSEGIEVTDLEPLPAVSTESISHLPVIDVIFDSEENNPNISQSLDCKNGGVPSGAGCICPAGFVGPECEQGCGRNAFGQDCASVCSIHSRECKGLILCVPGAGCRCAPGYKGTDCNSQCSVGEYGAGCAETCGQCAAETSCSIYTGECSMCAPGYVLPDCKKAYVYLSSKPELSSTDYGKIRVSFNTEYEGYGSPKLYQVQYRREDQDWITYTTKIFPKNITDSKPTTILPFSRTSPEHQQGNISEIIEGLPTGVLYQVRILLMDVNFNKYTGGLIKTSQIITKCDIPNDYSYNITSQVAGTSVNFSWTYYINESEHGCPVKVYEVMWKEDWKWLSNVVQSNISILDLLPGTEIQFKVRALTTGGYAPFSETVKAYTTFKGFYPVRDLQVVSSQSTVAEISWRPPLHSDSRKLRYRVTYKCVNQPACSPGCHNSSEGDLTQEPTSLTLISLLPFSQYLVTVSPQDGPDTSIYLGTKEVAPTEKPELSAQTPLATNTSLTVFWDPVPVCTSFLLGYNYHLIKETENQKMLATGFTTDTSVTFQNLTANTKYLVKIYVVTVAGWSPDVFITINASTTATGPEAVRNLTIYKQSRNMIGLRWAEPQHTFGKLKSFTVTHTLGKELSSHTVEPIRCLAWPELFCHTIEQLKANRRYNVTVSARNTEVAEDGEQASVLGFTKESPPTAPEELQLINVSSNSAFLQWSYPNLANGIIRSFVISIEEVETYDQDSCCQDFPLVETPVKEEKLSYSLEVSGLRPASTYYMGVTAKTIVMGPSRTLKVHTTPPHLAITTLPQLEINTAEKWNWLPQEYLSHGNGSDSYTTIIKAHLLLVALYETQPIQVTADSGISDPQLNSLLQLEIGKPFFFISEYNEADAVIENLVDVQSSIWGQPPSTSPLIGGQRYQLIAVQVTQYNGVYNVDLAYTTMFTYL